MITVDIESTEMETRQKKGGGSYQVQTGFAHVFERNGQPARYPEKFVFFPPRDSMNQPMPLKPGQYTLAPECIRIERGFISLGFPVFTRIEKNK